VTAGSGVGSVAEMRVQDPDGIKPQGLVVRALTAAVYAVVVLGAIWFGEHGPLGGSEPVVLGVVLGIFAGFAAAEFYALSRRESRLPNDTFGIAAAATMPVFAALWGLSGLTAVVTGLIAASLVWHVLFVRVRTADTALTVFGAVYTGFMLGYLVLILRVFSSGMVLAFAVVVSVWANDSFAYLIGSLVGRHKMAPRISPKKSWEGFAAGLAGTLVFWIATPKVMPIVFGAIATGLLDAWSVVQHALPWLPPHSAVEWWTRPIGLTMPWAIATGLAVSLAVVIGDFAESRMKREAGVKDSGSSLPGHGGFLDRLDSLILVCLVAYWMLRWAGVVMVH